MVKIVQGLALVFCMSGLVSLLLQGYINMEINLYLLIVVTCRASFSWRASIRMGSWLGFICLARLNCKALQDLFLLQR